MDDLQVKKLREEKIIKQFRCEECNSANTYITKEDRVCRKCGFRKKVEKEVEE